MGGWLFVLDELLTNDFEFDFVLKITPISCVWIKSQYGRVVMINNAVFAGYQGRPLEQLAYTLSSENERNIMLRVTMKLAVTPL